MLPGDVCRVIPEALGDVIPDALGVLESERVGVVVTAVALDVHGVAVVGWLT
jgi:hypothetical protein